MGTPSISVPTNNAIPIIQNSTTSPSVLTNSGQCNVYVDDQSTVSPTSNDFTIVPGQSIVWASGKSCYAIADVAPDGGGGFLDVSNNVGQFSSIPANGPGSPAVSILLNTALVDSSAQPRSVTLLNLSGYQTIQIRITQTASIVGSPFLQVKWLDASGLATLGSDVYTPTVGASGELYIYVPVRGVGAQLSMQGFTASGTSRLVVIGYASLMPAYAAESGANGTSGPGRISALTIPAIAAGNSSVAVSMALWSGRIEFLLHVPSANACYLQFNDQSVPAGIFGMASVPVILGAVQQQAFYGSFQGIRKPLTANLFNGAGATSQGTLTLSYSGTEN